MNEYRWNDLSSNNVIPPHQYATANKGANNNTLILYGSKSLNAETMALVYTFDTQSNSWSIPEISGIPPAGRTGVTLVVDYNGLIYLFGGLTSNDANGIYTNDMLILDSINFSWKQASSINAPSPRVQYSAVFLPNKNIIYMGM